MFHKLPYEKQKSLASLCCSGSRCQLDDVTGKTFFNVVHGISVEDEVVVWLRFGRDETRVYNFDPPSNDDAHWRVVEELR
jgi:hypothetical protein